MTTSPSPSRSTNQSPWRTRELLSLIALVYALHVIRMWSDPSDASSDFDVFYLVSQSFWSGTVKDAYRSVLYSADGYVHTGLRWTYPPPFVVLLSPLALFPKWLAYAVFMGGSSLAYLWALRRISPEHFGVVLMTTLPSIVVTLSSGQNGLLFGAILGLFALGTLRERSAAGVSLGLLALKPQMLPAAVTSLLIRGRWRELLLAAIVCGFGVTVSLITLGPSIWGDFLDTMRETKGILLQGHLPLFRMVSVYASFRSLGGGGALSMMAQFIAVVIALEAIVSSARQAEPRRHIGLVLFATMLFSPYDYDYDLPLVGLSLALLWPTLIYYGTLTERVLCLSCFSVASVWGLLYDLYLSSSLGSNAADHLTTAPTVSGLLMLISFVSIRRVVRRAKGST